MNAIQFIKEHGVEKARKVVEGAPEHCFVYDLERKEYVAYEDTSIAMCFLKNRFIDLSDLKRLVESVDLIESNGGHESIKDNFDFAWAHGADELTEYGERLKQAIADYESIYGGEHV